MHVGFPNIAGDDLQHNGQIAIISGSDGTLESRGDPWTSPSISEIRGLRRGASSAETLAIPGSYFGGSDPNDVFQVFRSQSIGPRLFMDAIIQDLPICPSFSDGHQVQRIIDAAIESDLTNAAQLF